MYAKLPISLAGFMKVLAFVVVPGVVTAFAAENYALWSGVRAYTINTSPTGVSWGGAVANFPLLVRLGGSDSVFAQAKANGADIRFTKADSVTRLHHEIDHWDSAAGTATIWVLMDQIQGNTADQIFLMRWGKSDAADSSNGAAVFSTSNGYIGVWHMDGSADEADATVNGNTAVAANAPGLVEGIIGGARSLSRASSQHFIVANHASLNSVTNAFTLSAWVNAVDWEGSSRIFQKGLGTDGNAAQYGMRENSNNQLAIEHNGSHYPGATNSVPATGTWALVHARFDGGANRRIYLNGAQLFSTATSTTTTNANTDPLNIGRRPDGTNYFNGIFDEMRVQNVARSSLWIQLEYENQKPGQTLVQVVGAPLPPPPAPAFVRKPFLQLGTPTSASVCWRVNPATSLTVRFGTDSANLNRQSAPSPANADACVSLDTLLPSTKYHYKVYAGTTEIPGAAEQYVVTHPPANSKAKHSFWVIGDFGIGANHGTYGNAQLRVRDAFVNVNGGNHTDGILMLGDNAYESGTDAEYTNGVFNVYPDIMANSFAWPVIGNHEAPNITTGHLTAWTLPAAAQSGGVASGTEYYYSFDYGNIHFICLDSEISNRTTTGPQYQWLQQDLQATQKDWIVVTFHHPPYTRGSHNSETESKHVDMRRNYLPLLEQYGVDLVFGGHSHNYERSYLIDSAYSVAGTNLATHNAWYADNRARIIKDSSSGNPATTGPYLKTTGGNKGAVYAVVGSSGKVAASNRHPMMFVNYGIHGSLILDIEDSVATGRFIDTTGTIRDQFRIVKSLSPTSIKEGIGRPVLKPSAAAFRQDGRVFSFAQDNRESLRVFALDGRLLFDGVPRGNWEASRKLFPAGEYYFRHGASLGKISLK